MSTRSSVEIGVLRESDILSEPSTHSGHLPDREAVKALEAVITLKRKAKENEGAPPAQVLMCEHVSSICAKMFLETFNQVAFRTCTMTRKIEAYKKQLK